MFEKLQFFKVLWINENRIERRSQFLEKRLIKSRRSIPSIFPPNKFCRRKWTDRISKRLCHVRNTALSNVGNDFTNRIDSRIRRTAMSLRATWAVHLTRGPSLYFATSDLSSSPSPPLPFNANHYRGDLKEEEQRRRRFTVNRLDDSAVAFNRIW